MQERLKTSFEHIRAKPDIKANTREFLFHKISEYLEMPEAYRNLQEAAIYLVFLLAGWFRQQ